jgi:hypothetical protein
MEGRNRGTSKGLCANDAVLEQVVTLKFCRFLPNKRCFHDSSDFLDSLGRVRVCKFHPNPYGRFSFRKPKVVHEE